MKFDWPLPRRRRHQWLQEEAKSIYLRPEYLAKVNFGPLRGKFPNFALGLEFGPFGESASEKRKPCVGSRIWYAAIDEYR